MGLVFQARIERALFDLLTNIIYYYTTRGTESYEDMKTSIRQKTGDFFATTGVTSLLAIKKTTDFSTST